ncbi:MAG: hypothetical protein AAB905_02445, partial [Patescibacteria group bacterium]
SLFEAKASTIRPCFPLGNLEITYLYLLFTCPICDNRKDPLGLNRRDGIQLTNSGQPVGPSYKNPAFQSGIFR